MSADFPTHPDAVTAGWLEAQIRSAGMLDRGAVTGFRWEPIGTGQVGDSVRFTLSYDREGAGPATLAGKFPAADVMSRQTAVAFGLYAKEVGFYRDLASLLDVRTPRALFADIAGNGADFALLFEDLGPARGGDQLKDCSLADARQGIAQLAALHAPSWGNAEMLTLPWLQAAAGTAERIKALYGPAQTLFRERYRDSLEPDLMRVCDELAESGDLWFGRSAAPRSLQHGDFRLDNLLFEVCGGTDPIAVLDWQTLAAGNGLTDLGYFLGCGVGDALRRAHEDDLIALYLAEMAARGVALTRDAIWDDYRLGALHGVSTAVFSAAYVERTPRGDANFLSMARGACALALAHDSLGALKEVTAC